MASKKMTPAEKVENLKMQLAAAQEEMKAEQDKMISQRHYLIGQIQDGVTGLATDMIQVGLLTVTITINEDGTVTVTEPGTRNGHTGGGNRGKVTLEPGTVITREFKGATYTLTAGEAGLAVTKDGEPVGTYTSLTSAAQAVCGGTVSGKSWWKI